MIITDLYNSSKKMSDSGVLFSYTGYLSDDIISSVGNALKARLHNRKLSSAINGKIFGIFIEQAQNILRYGDNNEEIDAENPFLAQGRHQYKDGFFCIGEQEEGCYFVVCGNIITHAKSQSLKQQLDNITNMSPEEIKSEYRKKLRGEATEYGSGLGLLDIARRSFKPLEYSFETLDDNFVFYLIGAFIEVKAKN